jgi:coatomer subunit beta'
VDLLIKTQRAPEAALFARTYAPSKIPAAVTAWKVELQGKNRGKLADAVADPIEHPELFEEGWKDAVLRETTAEKQHPPLPITSELNVLLIHVQASQSAHIRL